MIIVRKGNSAETESKSGASSSRSAMKYAYLVELFRHDAESPCLSAIQKRRLLSVNSLSTDLTLLTRRRLISPTHEPQ